MSDILTKERKRVPDFTGRLYTGEELHGIAGTWVRRAEVDVLLDEIERLHGLMHGIEEQVRQLQHERDAEHSPEPPVQPWAKLLADCMAQPCEYPCLRDDLGDWMKTNGIKWPDEPASRASPADLVGALQDVAHTDPGPVRAAYASRGAPSTVDAKLNELRQRFLAEDEPPAVKSSVQPLATDAVRDLACCDRFIRESASEFCAECGYTNLDHLRARAAKGEQP